MHASFHEKKGTHAAKAMETMLGKEIIFHDSCCKYYGVVTVISA